MKEIAKKSKLIVGAVVLALVLGVFIFRIAFSDPGEAPPSIAQLHKQQGVPVDLVDVTRREIKQTISVMGTLEGIEESDINSQIPMRIKKLYVESGSTIRKNQSLVTLDPLSMLMMYSNLESSKIHYANAMRDMERMRPLAKAGAISESDWDAIKAGVAQAKASMADNQHAMTLRSPIKGKVTRLFKKEGDVVHMGEPILTVSQTDQMKLVANVAQEQVNLMAVGDPAEIEIKTSKQGPQTITGKVHLVDMAAHPQTRLFRVEILFDNSESLLRSGTIQEAEIIVAHVENSLALPTRSVEWMNGSPNVYRANESTAKLIPIKTGISNADWTEVNDGLSEGDMVVENGQNLLDPNSEVKIAIHEKKSATPKK